MPKKEQSQQRPVGKTSCGEQLFDDRVVIDFFKDQNRHRTAYRGKASDAPVVGFSSYPLVAFAFKAQKVDTKTCG